MRGCCPGTADCSPTCRARSGGASNAAALRSSPISSKASTERHARYGHAGHLLEPNIRDSAGGLRDIHTLGWASKVLPGSRGGRRRRSSTPASSAGIDAELVDGRACVPAPAAHRAASRDRTSPGPALPRRAGRGRRAARVRRHSTDARPPTGSCRSSTSTRARSTPSSSNFWDRVLHLKPRRRFRGSSQRERPWPTAASSRTDGSRSSRRRTSPTTPPGWMRVFRQSALRGVPVGRHSINRLHEEIAAAPKPLPWSAETRDVFLDVLQSGSGGARVLDDDGHGRPAPRADPGVGGRSARSRSATSTTATPSTGTSSPPSRSSRAAATLTDPDVRDAWTAVGDPDALFVGALMHDIGEGTRRRPFRPGGRARRAASPSAWGSRQRRPTTSSSSSGSTSLLAETATRRDLNDPKTTEETAARVGDVRRLAMLHLLTRADSLATGPEAWSSFRSSLVRELYVRTRDAPRGRPGARGRVRRAAFAAVRRARPVARRRDAARRTDARVLGD